MINTIVFKISTTRAKLSTTFFRNSENSDAHRINRQFRLNCLIFLVLSARYICCVLLDNKHAPQPNIYKYIRCLSCIYVAAVWSNICPQLPRNDWIWLLLIVSTKLFLGKFGEKVHAILSRWYNTEKKSPDHLHTL